jgi:hypothetical protein
MRNREPIKNRDELRCSGKIFSSCFRYDTHPVTRAIGPVNVVNGEKGVLYFEGYGFQTFQYGLSG